MVWLWFVTICWMYNLILPTNLANSHAKKKYCIACQLVVSPPKICFLDVMHSHWFITESPAKVYTMVELTVCHQSAQSSVSVRQIRKAYTSVAFQFAMWTCAARRQMENSISGRDQDAWSSRQRHTEGCNADFQFRFAHLIGTRALAIR